ncbi:SprT-like domain-containing protein [Bacteroidota bacterium]
MRDKFISTISKYIPEESVTYCTKLWNQSKFSFKVTRNRTTKLGDYRYDSAGSIHIISVNGSLNRFAFLITFVHEVAHMYVKDQYGRNVRPHGKEWKDIFRNLIFPLLHPGIFPDDILRVLANHMRNPKASSQSDINLNKVLHCYDKMKPDGWYLEDLVEGEQFFFNKRQFKKLESKRTRAICMEVNSGRKYLITESAMVKKI